MVVGSYGFKLPPLPKPVYRAFEAARRGLEVDQYEAACQAFLDFAKRYEADPEGVHADIAGLRRTFPELAVVPPSRAQEIVTLTLTATHLAPDRKQYGPGEVSVTRKIAAWLREREEIEPLRLTRSHSINGVATAPASSVCRVSSRNRYVTRTRRLFSDRTVALPCWGERSRSAAEERAACSKLSGKFSGNTW